MDLEIIYGAITHLIFFSHPDLLLRPRWRAEDEEEKDDIHTKRKETLFLWGFLPHRFF